MANIAAWLLALAWPIAKKVLVMLGIGWATYEGLGLLASQVTSQVADYWGQMPASFIQIATLSGIAQAVGIVLGAFTARASFMAMGKLTKLAS